MQLVSVVDDNLHFRDSMRRLMRSLGYSAESFASASGFLASSRLEQTACLIADVNMPRMTGIELHRRLVESGQVIPTILVTAYPNEVDRVRAARDGVVCYLRKPINEDELTHCLQAALTASARSPAP